MAKTVVRAVGRAFLALHRRLLPPNPRIGWVPYLWLFWLIGFFAKWWFVPLEPVELTLALLTLPVFLALYLNGFWHSGRRVFVNIAGILLIALVWTPFNPNAMGFFIYASGFVGRADRPPRAYAWLAGVVLLVAVEWLTFERERQVLRLAGEGASGAAIAAELRLSEGTVRNYLSEAISKLGASNRVEAARIARQRGWL